MVGVRLQLHRSFIDERVHVVQRPVAIALDAKAIAKALVLPAASEEIRRARVDGLEDLQLHAELRDGLGIALLLDQLLYLGFEVADLLLVVVHPKTSVPL